MRLLSDFIVREAIIPDLHATTKEEAIREMVPSVHHAGHLGAADLEGITRAILLREELGSTGIGQGIACPETRHPAVGRVIGIIALSRQGIDFDALEVLSGFLAFDQPEDRHIERAVTDLYTLTNHGVFVAALGPLAKSGLEALFGGGTVESLRYAGVSMCLVFLVGLVVLPFLPETKDRPLPE